jgi:hypothetical protein
LVSTVVWILTDVPETVLAVSVDEVQFDGTKALPTDDWGQIRTGQTGNLDAGTCHWPSGTVTDSKPRCAGLAIFQPSGIM